MHEREKAIREIVAKGLAINAAHGTARALVYLLHHQIPRDTVLAMLGEAASLTRSRTPLTKAGMPQQEV